MSRHRLKYQDVPLRMPTPTQRGRAERSAAEAQPAIPQWPTEDRDEPRPDPHAACRLAHDRLVAGRVRADRA